MGKLKRVGMNITHAFYMSYVHDNDPAKLSGANCPLFYNFLEAVDAACPRLQRVSLQTGGKVCFHGTNAHVLLQWSMVT